MMKHMIGKKVTQDIVNSVGLVIIPAKKIIREEHLDLFILHKIDCYSILLEAENGAVSNPSKFLIEQVMEQSVELFEFIRQNRKIPIMEFKSSVVPVIDQITTDPNIFRLFQSLKAMDNYTLRHNIGVAVISTLIGKWMKLDARELNTLTLAGLLHDVGNLRIPQDILSKEGELKEEEYKFIKQHTVFGYEMLKDTIGISNRIALAALQHHEREDGSGYPFNLKKDQIDPLSKIISVADIFHAMYSKRPYRDPIPLLEIIKQLRTDVYGKLDPTVVTILINNISNKFLGKKVLLSDGRKGSIVYINPYEQPKPLIQVNSNYFIDLSKQRKLRIAEIVL